MGLVARVGYSKVPLSTFPSLQDPKMAKVEVVVMVKDGGALSATAYLQTQKNLIEDLEFAYGKYRTYQVPVANIEQLTGLDFGELRKHDPIARIEATVGRVIERAEDIRL